MSSSRQRSVGVQIVRGVLFAVALLGTLLLALLPFGSERPKRVVVLYCAQDQVFAEPILAEFTKQTGIRVKAVFDSEAVKTVGLANRLLAERTHPVCDVFWGNEVSAHANSPPPASSVSRTLGSRSANAAGGSW